MEISSGRLVAAGVVVTTVLGVALLLFEPWTLVVDEQVAEALPVVEPVQASAPSTPPTSSGPPADGSLGAGTASPTGDVPPSGPGPTPGPEPTTPTGPVELVRGDLISHEHATTGTARVLLLPDGSRVLRLEGLDTSNGPDLHVWLTDAPVIEGRDGWFVFDDGQVVDLGELRGNQGDANYAIPPDVDLDVLTSVSIWCERFAVSFGAVELS